MCKPYTASHTALQAVCADKRVGISHPTAPAATTLLIDLEPCACAGSAVRRGRQPHLSQLGLEGKGLRHGAGLQARPGVLEEGLRLARPLLLRQLPGAALVRHVPRHARHLDRPLAGRSRSQDTLLWLRFQLRQGIQGSASIIQRHGSVASRTISSLGLSTPLRVVHEHGGCLR